MDRNVGRNKEFESCCQAHDSNVRDDGVGRLVLMVISYLATVGYVVSALLVIGVMIAAVLLVRRQRSRY